MGRTIKIRVDSKNASHVWVSVFSGKDRDHLAKNGQLVLLHDELDALTVALVAGSRLLDDVDVLIDTLDGATA